MTRRHWAGVELHSFLTSAFDAAGLSVLRPGPLYPRKPTDSEGAPEPVRTFLPLPDIKPRFLGPPACSLVRDWTFPEPAFI